MGVDVLLVGASKFLRFAHGKLGGLIMFPGSATGAGELTDDKDADPSFLLMDIRGKKIVAFSYMLTNGVRMLLTTQNLFAFIC
mmetsp:Transcript_12882/g.39638  ORF Transcript_12882/g.39638 Transcript_12882/m.39638 type:complete len:83 (-) Transcript_12882:1010-1258(-)